MLTPRAIATLGIGYEPLVGALLGLWPTEGAVPPAPTFSDGGSGGAVAGPRRRPKKRSIEEYEALRLLGML